MSLSSSKSKFFSVLVLLVALIAFLVFWAARPSGEVLTPGPDPLSGPAGQANLPLGPGPNQLSANGSVDDTLADQAPDLESEAGGGGNDISSQPRVQAPPADPDPDPSADNDQPRTAQKPTNYEPDWAFGNYPRPGDPNYNPDYHHPDGTPIVGPDGRSYYQLDDILEADQTLYSTPPGGQPDDKNPPGLLDDLDDNGPDPRNPPPPSLIIIPPNDKILPQTATGKVQIVRAITDKSVHNTHFSVYYEVGPTIAHQDGEALAWRITKPSPEADWLVWDSTALTLAGQVPSSFALGDSITITVSALDAATLTDGAEYSFSITSLGPYNPEPLGCRATSSPIATKSWIKVGNWEWSEPNHNPAIPASTPGYWQPDWVGTTPAGHPTVGWYAPYITKDSRRVSGETEIWRMKEVEYYRITRSPAWEWGTMIVSKDTGVTQTDGTVWPGANGALLVKETDSRLNGVRQDGRWRYAIYDLDREAGAKGYIYTIEASTCDDGPWSTPLELQWRFPNAPTMRPEFTRLTRYDGDGHLLPDNKLAVNASWSFQRSQNYQLHIEVNDENGDFVYQELRLFVNNGEHTYTVRFDRPVVSGDELIADSNLRVKVRVKAACTDCGGSGSSPYSETITLSTNRYDGPKAND